MKRIPLKSISIPTTEIDPKTGKERPGEPQTLNYRDNIMAIMRTPASQQGPNYEEMRRSFRILNLFDELPLDAEYLELEDADFDILKGRMTTAAHYQVYDKYVFQFVEDVTNPKE